MAKQKCMVYHVAKNGSDGNSGALDKPLLTISAAAAIAQPGDVITVHEGVYRERINPPRGGISDERRIVYQAAKGAQVVIKGSEVVKGWTFVKNDTWQVTLPDDFFGAFNPFKDVITGDWFKAKGKVHHTGAVYLDALGLAETFTLNAVCQPVGKAAYWFAQTTGDNVTIWAQFKGVDPNKQDVEVNARQTVFYPKKPGINYITVQGFTMAHAANNWAPPTAEQIGLIGTHWSKGWVIENNTIRYAACSGVALGKHGDAFDNTSQDSAEGYIVTIKRALKQGWSKENIGHHVVRNNHISHCGQAGIVGSLGAAFSTITGNEVHDIHLEREFDGEEMAGIKFHGAIDTVISHNHIYRCGGHGGMWLDWMTQGTRVTGNLFHDNSRDLFVEVNHGPFLIDNNLFLSPINLFENSGGGAYVHNVFGGLIKYHPELTRETPYLKVHRTAIAGISIVVGDDNRFYNNLIVGYDGLSFYDALKPKNLQAQGNVYLDGAKPSCEDRNALVAGDFDPAIKLTKKNNGWWLTMAVDPVWSENHSRDIVTTDTLGKALKPNLPYVTPDEVPYSLDTDYFNNARNRANPAVGPFVDSGAISICLKVWPKQ